MSKRGPAVTDDAIRRFEAKISSQLPEDYRAFLLEINGGYTANSHTTFRRRKHSSTLDILFSLDTNNESEDLATRQQYSPDLPPGGLPVGYSDGGIIILILTGEHCGEVWELDTVDPRPEGSNPRVEWFDRRDVTRLAGSFRDFMASLRPPAGTAVL
jgi:hypothetical protein